MRTIAAALLAAFAVSIPAACQEPSGAQLKALLERLEAKVEQLTSQVEAQRADSLSGAAGRRFHRLHRLHSM
jgi:hypothetical protein